MTDLTLTKRELVPATPHAGTPSGEAHDIAVPRHPLVHRMRGPLLWIVLAALLAWS